MNLGDERKPYELPSDELATLIGKFEEVADTKFNGAFADNINNMISILRNKHLIAAHISDNKKVKRSLIQYKEYLEKIMRMQNSEMDHWAHQLLMANMPNHTDTIITANEAMDDLMIGCNRALESLPERKKQANHSFSDTRQIIATDLAREIAAFGIKITVYREGVFGLCLKEFLYAFNGNAGGETFQMYIPEDLIQLIKTASDNHSNSEPHFLRKFR